MRGFFFAKEAQNIYGCRFSIAEPDDSLHKSSGRQYHPFLPDSLEPFENRQIIVNPCVKRVEW